jgi:Tfp pilus assembly protein PilV
MHPRGAHSQQTHHAFTLAEVMMATVVLLIAIVGLFEAVTIGAGMLNVSRKQSIALQIIRTEIESVHLTAWPGFAPDSTISFPVDTADTVAYPELKSLKNIGKGFTLTRTVVTIKSSPNWLKKITFSVSWSEPTGRAYSRTGYTYSAKNGINALYQR